jgi:hypothetical protein
MQQVLATITNLIGRKEDAGMKAEKRSGDS